MTTYDVDTFEAAFLDDAEREDDAGQERSGHGRGRRALLAAVVAALLVGAGVVGALALRSGPATDAVTAEELVPALAAAATAQDAVSGTDLQDLDVRPGSTRLIATTRTGAHYAAVGTQGQLCVVTVPRGDLPSRLCVPAAPGAWIPVDDTLRLVTAGGPQPDAEDGWVAAGDLVWTR
ncbi:hypothetical protein [Cellulomonas massiliensis]|uniref:hypothetical protein n=1 Tax=Cellulomonas massiliensis TaxID=1465811 RepID=UPI0003196EAD|nr:hypothetical protein [Cellulomonas massiliensis]